MVVDDDTYFLYLKSEVNSNDEGDGNDDDEHDKKECNDSLVILIQKQVNLVSDVHLNKFTRLCYYVSVVNNDKKIGIYFIIFLPLGDVQVLIYVNSEIGRAILANYGVCVPCSLGYTG